MTAMLRPVCAVGGCGPTRSSSKARSTIDTSTCLIVTGSVFTASTHAASHGAGQIQPGELREVVRGVQPLAGAGVVTARDELVPLRDQVAQRAPAVAERDTAVHAARRLLADDLVLGAQVDRLPVAHALAGRPLRGVDAVELQEALGVVNQRCGPLLTAVVRTGRAAVSRPARGVGGSRPPESRRAVSRRSRTADRSGPEDLAEPRSGARVAQAALRRGRTRDR